MMPFDCVPLPAAAATAATPATCAAKLHIRALSDPRSVFVVDAKRAWHVPPAAADETHVLCPYLDAFSPMVQRQPGLWGCCPRGAACAHVHADLRGATKYSPHLMAVARDVPQAYSWFPSGATVTLVPPTRDEGKTFTHPSGRLLRTRAFDVVGGAVICDPAAPASVCAHFDAKQRCDRGARCKFAHVVAEADASVAAARCESGDFAQSRESFQMATPDTAGSPAHATPKLASTPAGESPTPLSTRSPSSAASGNSTPRARAVATTRRGWRHDPYRAVVVTSASVQ